MIFRVKALAAGGDGVAVLEQGADDGAKAGRRTIFVSKVATGDLVDAQRVERIRGVDRAVEWSLVEAGPHRVQPPCAHASVCGGCPWMQVDYAEQVRAKADLLARALRQNHLSVEESGESGPDVVASKEVLGYRRRARLFWRSSESEVLLGFHSSMSHDVVDVTDQACPVLHPVLQGLLPGLARALTAAHRIDPVWGQGQVMLLTGHDGSAQAAFMAGPEHGRPIPWTSSDPSSFRALLDDLDSLVGVGLWSGAQGWTWLGESDLVLDADSGFVGNAAGFAQANPSMDALVRAEAVRRVGDAGSVLELYAGGGNLTRDLAGPDRWITAVELDREAVAAMARVAGAWPGRVKPVRADAARFVRKALARKMRFDVVVADPPRKGLSKLAKLLVGLGPRRIVLVSCDPMTAARDLAVFVAAGYRLKTIEGFDTMPHTSHFELVALVEKDDRPTSS